MNYPYLSLATRKPVYSLGGAMTRHRPIVPFHIIGPGVLPPLLGSIDSGADDTLFPQYLARRLGIDLSNAPQGESRPVGQGTIPVLYSRVRLLLSDGFETCEWEAIVAFADIPLRWSLLGHAGFLQFFDTNLRGALREVILSPNSSFQGRHVIHRQRP